MFEEIKEAFLIVEETEKNSSVVRMCWRTVGLIQRILRIDEDPKKSRSAG